jgi:PTS system nitrogen regulatory IIA component
MSPDISAPFPIAPNRFEPLLTPADAGLYLGVHQKTAIKMAREGSIPALRVGEKHWRFRRTDLESWVEQQVKSGSPARIE